MIVSIVAAMIAVPAAESGAAIIDLTAGPGTSGTVNGALFEFGNGAGGTGLIMPFVRLQRSGTQQGYNTSNPVLPFDEKGGSWTHDLRLNEIPIITIDGVKYFEFLLDINESGGGGHQFLSLDRIKIFTSSIGSQNTTNINSLGTLRYDLDAGADSHIRMDYTHNAGSGESDMTAFIPISLFAGANPTDFVYFYSFFGEQGTIAGQRFGASNGFEEWAVQVDANSVFIPSPGALALLAVSLCAAGSSRRRRPDGAS